MTFTNKAAGELKGRVESLITRLGLVPTPDPRDPLTAAQPRVRVCRTGWARFTRSAPACCGAWLTAPSCPRTLRFSTRDDQLKLCKVCQRENIDDTAMPRGPAQPDRSRQNHGLLPEQYRGRDYFTDLVARLYPLYQSELARLGAVDFGDLLLWPVVLCDRDPELRALLSRRFQHVLVDEFQDVNPVQYQFLRHLAAGHRQPGGGRR